MHVKGNFKHVETATALEKSEVPQDNFLRAKQNPVHLTDGGYFIRMSREESKLHWLKSNTSRTPTGSTGASPRLSVPDPIESSNSKSSNSCSSKMTKMGVVVRVTAGEDKPASCHDPYMFARDEFQQTRTRCYVREDSSVM